MLIIQPEALVRLFRNRPALAVELLAEGLVLSLPLHDELRLESPALTEVVPVAYRADLVIELALEGTVVLGIVVEVQLGPDPDKRLSWPLYVASLRAELGCPCCLLVVAPEPAVAAWCDEPIALGHPGLTLAPLVLGAEAVPVIVDADRARASPELAVLSAMANGAGPRGLEVALAALGAAAGLDEERSRFYTDLVMASLGGAARQALEELMQSGNYEYQSEFAEPCSASRAKPRRLKHASVPLSPTSRRTPWRGAISASFCPTGACSNKQKSACAPPSMLTPDTSTPGSRWS